MSKPKKHYVNNKDFYQAIVDFKTLRESNSEAKISNYIGVCLTKICEKLSTKPNFFGYSYRDEMISDGIENCIHAVATFDPEKSNNPFAYFTQIAWNAFLRRIAKEKKQQYIKHKNMQNFYLSGEISDNYGDTGGQIQLKNNEISNDVIEEFENKLTKSLTSSKKSCILGIEKFCEAESV